MKIYKNGVIFEEGQDGVVKIIDMSSDMTLPPKSFKVMSKGNYYKYVSNPEVLPDEPLENIGAKERGVGSKAVVKKVLKIECNNSVYTVGEKGVEDITECRTIEGDVNEYKVTFKSNIAQHIITDRVWYDTLEEEKLRNGMIKRIWQGHNLYEVGVGGIVGISEHQRLGGNLAEYKIEYLVGSDKFITTDRVGYDDAQALVSEYREADVNARMKEAVCDKMEGISIIDDVRQVASDLLAKNAVDLLRHCPKCGKLTHFGWYHHNEKLMFCRDCHYILDTKRVDAIVTEDCEYRVGVLNVTNISLIRREEVDTYRVMFGDDEFQHCTNPKHIEYDIPEFNKVLGCDQCNCERLYRWYDKDKGLVICSVCGFVREYDMKDISDEIEVNQTELDLVNEDLVARLVDVGYSFKGYEDLRANITEILAKHALNDFKLMEEQVGKNQYDTIKDIEAKTKELLDDKYGEELNALASLAESLYTIAEKHGGGGDASLMGHIVDLLKKHSEKSDIALTKQIVSVMYRPRVQGTNFTYDEEVVGTNGIDEIVLTSDNSAELHYEDGRTRTILDLVEVTAR